MRGPVAATAVLMAGSLPAFADFEGIYRQAANADCGLVGVDGGALQIKDNVFYGVDSTCKMVDAVNVTDMDAVLYNMQCTGEDGDWSARAMLLHAADGGLIMVWDGYAFKYDRCPDPDGTTASEAVGAALPEEPAAKDAEPSKEKDAKAEAPASSGPSEQQD